MARKAREKSELGIYLVNLKGVEDVAFNNDDKINFLNILYKNKTNLLGYTLLNNSFLFVVKEDDRTLDTLLRTSIIKYVKKFNKKYDRQGKVFQGRYISFAAHTMIEVWNFVANVHKLAFINSESISSSNNYFENNYVNSNYSLKFFDSKADFIDTCNNINTSASSVKLSDEEIKNYIIKTFQIHPHNISKMPETLIDSTLSEIFKVTKASARQIARITSLPLRLLWNIAKRFKPKSKSKMKVVQNESESN